MGVATFDTLKFSKAAREAGVPQLQADAEAVVLAEVFSLNFRDVVTKDDLKHAVETVEGKLRELEQRIDGKLDLLRAEIRELRQEIRSDHTSIGQRISAELQQTRSEYRSLFDQQRVELTYIKWVLGFLAASGLGLLVRLVFFPAN